MCGFMSGVFIRIHWSSCLFLCKYYALFIVMSLEYSLKLGIVMPPALDFLLIIALAIQGFCVSICISRLIFLFLCRMSLGF
jgi:hypothetical protein